MHRNCYGRALRGQGMNCMAHLLGKIPHNPRQIPASNSPSQYMNDVVAVLSDPFFFVSDAEHELGKRNLKSFGCKDELVSRLYEALEAEHADGWTLGYLLNTKILPFNGKGRDPRSLIGYHVVGYQCDGDGNITLGLSDGEDVTILSSESSGECTVIKMDHDLFWALHTPDGMKAVPRDLVKHPLQIIAAATGVRKNRWGKEAGSVFGLKLEGMMAMSFFFLTDEVSSREDRICGDVWLEDNYFLREDTRILHGGDEMAVEDVRKGQVSEDEAKGLGEDMRGLHGEMDESWLLEMVTYEDLFPENIEA